MSVLKKAAYSQYIFEKKATYMIKLIFKKLRSINPLNANLTKWSNTLKQFVGNLPTNCLSVFDHFVGLVLKGLRYTYC